MLYTATRFQYHLTNGHHKSTFLSLDWVAVVRDRGCSHRRRASNPLNFAMKKPTVKRIRDGLTKIRNLAERSACAKFAWWRLISDKEGVRSSDEVHSLQEFFTPSVRPVHPDRMAVNLKKLGYDGEYIERQLVSARTTETHREEQLGKMTAKKRRNLKRSYERAITDRERQIGL